MWNNPYFKGAEFDPFYEAWHMLDADSSVTTDKSQSTITIADSSEESSVTTVDSSIVKSSVVTDELQVASNRIDIYHSIAIPNAIEFPMGYI